MKIRAFLANHAEVQNNLLYATGAGIERTIVPAGAAPPWAVSIAIGILVTVTWTQTNQQHTLAVDLVDADGRPVEIPTGPDSTGPFHASLAFNVGRPPDLRPGDDQTVSLAIGMPGLPMPALGDYRFNISVDGSTEEELRYRLMGAHELTVGPTTP